MNKLNQKLNTIIFFISLPVLIFSQGSDCEINNVAGGNGTWSLVNCDEYHGQQFTAPDSGAILNSIVIQHVNNGTFPCELNVSFSKGNNTLNPTTTFQTTITQPGSHTISFPMPIILLPSELYTFSLNNPNDEFGCGGGTECSFWANFTDSYPGGNVIRESNGITTEFPFDFGFSLDIDCCPVDYNGANKLDGLVSKELGYQAQNDILSCQVLDNNIDFSYNAGNSIELDKGFETKSGVLFHAYILGCSN